MIVMVLISLCREQDLPNRNPNYDSNVKTSSNAYHHSANTNHPSKIQTDSNSKYSTDQPSSSVNNTNHHSSKTQYATDNLTSSSLNPPRSFNTYKNLPHHPRNNNIPLSGTFRNNDAPHYNTYDNSHTKNRSISRVVGVDNKPSSSSSSSSNNSYNNNTLNNSQYMLQPSSHDNISNRSRVVTSTNHSSAPGIIHPNESSGLMNYSMGNISKPKTLEEAKRLVSGLNTVHPKMGYTSNNSFPKPILNVNLNNTSNTITNTNPTNQPPRINYGHSNSNNSNQNRKIPLNVNKNVNSPKIKYN